MNNKFKSFWFKYYVWLVLVTLIICAFVILTAQVTDKPFALLATCIGIALTTIYFVQKQKLEEIKLFKELFTEFNQRYDNLNGEIADIKSKTMTDLSETNKILDDYFNLCAEEYLFYSEGRIHNLVWGAWCRGMKEHLSESTINDYWEKAQKENSYYGLTTKVIEKGATITT